VKKLQCLQVRNAANIRVRKAKLGGQSIKASQVANEEVLQDLIRTDAAYRDFKQLRESPDYWDKAKKDLFAMLRQLGQPTFFMTLSAADLQWPDLLRCLYEQQHGQPLSDDNLAALTATQRMDLVRND
ncbi:hypothetical protein Agub_g12709, partial [Astrephomene gubernaculifera]